MKKSRHLERRLPVIGLIIVLVCVLVCGSLPDGPLVITPPPANGEPGRWVHIEGAANTRDAGGYPTNDGRFVKRGMIYRSAKLSHLSATGAAAYRELGIKTVIDFCNRLTPWPLFGGDTWSVQLVSSVHGCPMSFSKQGPAEEFYIRGVRENAAEYRRAFELLADSENYPVLYHCRAGTDRTGVMSALLLSLLHVDRATVLADFRLSEQVELPGSLPAMNVLLDRIEADGGIENFLEEIDVSRVTQVRIRENLLE